jgi:hypothetical protein
MAQYGTIITNYNNRIIIDNDYMNYAVKATGSVNLGTGINSVDIAACDTPCLFFIRPSYSGYSRWSHIIRYGGITAQVGVASNTGQTINYLLLKAGQVNSIPSGTYGVVFYNSSGNVIFSSEDSYAKVVGIYTVTEQSNYNDAEISVTVSNANENFFLYQPQNMYWYVNNYVSYLYTPAVRAINTTTVGIKPILWYSRAFGSHGYGSYGSFVISVQSAKLLEVKVG